MERRTLRWQSLYWMTLADNCQSQAFHFPTGVFIKANEWLGFS